MSMAATSANRMSQHKMSMVGWPTDCSRIFCSETIKGRVTKWVVTHTEGNDPLLDNHQNFMQRYRAKFENLARKVITNWDYLSAELVRTYQIFSYMPEMCSGMSLLCPISRRICLRTKKWDNETGSPQNLFQYCVLIDGQLEELWHEGNK